MNRLSITTVAFAMLAAPVFADGHASGDAAAGEKVFKKCKACHSIIADDGTKIQKGGRTGPNLYGVYDRVAGTFDGFKFGGSIVEAGEKGLMWNEADFVSYVADPKKFLATYLDDKKAKSKMSLKIKKEADAQNVWAYLVSVGPGAPASN
ncbi:cytochrome C [Sulfitobacter sp. SK012]|uniref:c-type cytochrome n=1 Tax=Sulfitobacter sp. SK012 TaxID=1389005 RepID=UPI000E09F01F|nr:c-type cytochrome [Sulfitobacter sp. SK012]AXI44768.1 cytochrome C [Sulfitobacter sp. SK012]